MWMISMAQCSCAAFTETAKAQNVPASIVLLLVQMSKYMQTSRSKLLLLDPINLASGGHILITAPLSCADLLLAVISLVFAAPLQFRYLFAIVTVAGWCILLSWTMLFSLAQRQAMLVKRMMPMSLVLLLVWQHTSQAKRWVPPPNLPLLTVLCLKLVMSNRSASGQHRSICQDIDRSGPHVNQWHDLYFSLAIFWECLA